MAKRNGGIIGPSNVPTGQYGGTASGVWRLRDAFNYIKAGLWPVAGNYPVGNSLRFNGPSSDYLNRNSNNNTDPTKVTWSFWTKRSSLTDTRRISTAMTASFVKYHYIRFEDGILNIYNSAGTAYTLTQQFRDVGAWYHVVVSIDTTLATSTDRVKVYINGSQVTAFTSSTAPTQNAGIFIGETSNAPFVIGALYGVGYEITSGSPTEFYSGYLSEFYLIDGQALTPSSFGQTDSATGIWTPLPYTGTYGTNGFYLKFANSAALGTDSSGNGNNFTVNNLTSVDQSTDTPTNNFCTMNPLSNFHNDAAFTDGNNTVDCGGTGSAAITSTIGVSSGKWYAEFKNISGTGGGAVFGIESLSYQTGVTDYVGYNLYSWGYFQQDGTIKNNNSTIATYSTQGNGDICGIALDLTNNKIYFSKNGTWQNSADPSAGTGGISITAPASTNTGLYLFAGSDDNQYAARTFSSNFGSPPYAANSYADGAGYGNFSYAVPSGYYALCTKNLATYG